MPLGELWKLRNMGNTVKSGGKEKRQHRELYSFRQGSIFLRETAFRALRANTWEGGRKKRPPDDAGIPWGSLKTLGKTKEGGGAHFSSYKSKVCNSDQLSPWEPYGWANILKILAKSCYSAPPGVCRPDGAHLNQHCFPSCRGPPTSTWQPKKL